MPQIESCPTHWLAGRAGIIYCGQGHHISGGGGRGVSGLWPGPFFNVFASLQIFSSYYVWIPTVWTISFNTFEKNRTYIAVNMQNGNQTIGNMPQFYLRTNPNVFETYLAKYRVQLWCSGNIPEHPMGRPVTNTVLRRCKKQYLNDYMWAIYPQQRGCVE